MRCTEPLRGKSLFAADFDGTLFLTSEPSPDGTTVNSAYFDAIDYHIGTDASAEFAETGGHRHRSPAEIVLSLVGIENAARVATLEGRITTTKLEILEGCIGQNLDDGVKWPRPMNGFLEFWANLQQARSSGYPIGSAIISAGHTSFISRTFQAHDLLPPDVLVTDDVRLGLGLTTPLDQQVKPAPFMLHQAQRVWIEQYSHSSSVPRTIYVGDDPVRDGGMAANAGVEFVLISQENASDAWARISTFLGLGTTALNVAANGHQK